MVITDLLERNARDYGNETALVEIAPSLMESAKVTWKSSNKKVATVNKGTVKAKKAGKTTITAKVSGKTLKCSVTVKKK